MARPWDRRGGRSIEARSRALHRAAWQYRLSRRERQGGRGATPTALVVLDRSLPDGDGVEVCRELRTFSDAYVVMVTARDDEIDKIVGLTVGADDYVTKPFSPRELAARIRAMRRRPRAVPQPGMLEYAALRIDTEAREATMDGDLVELTKIEYDLLELLALSPRRTYTREQLLRHEHGNHAHDGQILQTLSHEGPFGSHISGVRARDDRVKAWSRTDLPWLRIEGSARAGDTRAGLGETGAVSWVRPATDGAARLTCLAPWAAVSGAAVLGAATLAAAGSSGLERFVGPLPGPVVVAAAGGAGLGALVFLERRGFWRCGTRATVLRGVGLAGAAALPLAAVAIGVDVAVGFPSDTNVVWPAAWVVYPVIAVVAETAFHLLPLSALVWLTRSHFHDLRLTERTLALVLAAAAVEPLAQAALGSMLLPFVVPHVFLIGVVEMLLLRRFGYVPMVAFRLLYYLAWHVLWGQARLELLF
jgi:DNA-binding response OmpR family regulator